jgi:hypothetical protein
MSYEKGSEAARQQLQDHCDELNLKEHGRKHWFVDGKSPSRFVNVREHHEGRQ